MAPGSQEVFCPAHQSFSELIININGQMRAQGENITNIKDSLVRLEKELGETKSDDNFAFRESSERRIAEAEKHGDLRVATEREFEKGRVALMKLDAKVYTILAVLGFVFLVLQAAISAWIFHYLNK
jgi:hypothetical protein